MPFNKLKDICDLYDKTEFSRIVSDFSEESYIKFFLLKSICKWEAFKSFNKFLLWNDIQIVKKVGDWFNYYINSDEISNELLLEFVLQEYSRQTEFINIDEIITELSKLPSFDWGWIYQNALEWKIVKYIQKTYKFDETESLLKWELFISYLSYWMSSWYNYWSSVIVEHYFKIHSRIIPTVWLIKHIDFLFDKVPVDLKVTYLPQEYVDMRRKEAWLEREFKELKSSLSSLEWLDFTIENLGIISQAFSVAKNLNKPVFAELKEFRNSIVKSLLEDNNELIRLMWWLYENQGTRRYDNSYRLFLICIDDIDIIWAWQMKINIWLQDKINDFLDQWLNLQEVEYIWEWSDKKTKATALIVTKSSL